MWVKQFYSWCRAQTAGVLSSWRSTFCFVSSKAIRLHYYFIDVTLELMDIFGLIKRENNGSQRLMLYRLS